jgi:hypothetical protein
MSALHRLAGSKGGQETKRLYGVEFFAAIGSTGGRLTWREELERDKALRDKALRDKARKRNGRHSERD